MWRLRRWSVKRTVRLAFALLLTHLGAGAVRAAAPEKPDLAAAVKGKVAYQRYCTSCHGRAGRGDGSLAGDLRVAVPDLTTLARRSNGSYPFERVVSVIDGRKPARGHGTPDMPAWGDAFTRTDGTPVASPEEVVQAVAHYIWSLQAATR